MNSDITKDKETGTRQRILDVSARFFADRGFSNTSIRDIAAELEIANPSLYYHFHSKAEILAELLAEPLKRVELAVSDAEQFTGDERTKRIIGGLLDALEVHSGIAITGFRENDAIPTAYSELARGIQPMIVSLLGGNATTDNRDLRVTMAIGAVEAAVTDLMRSTSADGEPFVEKLRASRSVIIECVLKILH